MHPAPHYADPDPEFARALIRAHPWVTIVSLVADDEGTLGPVVSQYPALLDQREGANTDGDISIVSHMSRPDAELHGIGSGLPCSVIVTGAHGYVSPQWYLGDDARERIPTWNVELVVLHGVAERLSDEENFAELTRLVDHFEAPLPNPIDLRDEAYAPGVARGTVGLRLTATRVEAKAKLSQNKSPESRLRVIEALESPGPYRNDALARVMRRRDGLAESESDPQRSDTDVR